MKKLLSFILCIALLTGVCAAASAAPLIFSPSSIICEPADDNDAPIFIVHRMYESLENAANESTVLVNTLSDPAYKKLEDFLKKTGISESIKNYNDKLITLSNIMKTIKDREIIQEEALWEAKLIANSAVSLIPHFQVLSDLKLPDLSNSLLEYCKAMGDIKLMDQFFIILPLFYLNIRLHGNAVLTHLEELNKNIPEV